MELISKLPEINNDGQLKARHIYVTKSPDNENILRKLFLHKQ
jgi:hypothetical protein